MKYFNKFLKIFFVFFIFLLPFHALIVTTLKCKFGIDTNLLRFWKEVLVMLLLLATFIDLHLHKQKISNLLKGNYLVGLTLTFIISSLVFIGFPYLEFKVSNFLGFKYDVFFLFCLLIGIYLNFIKDNFKLMLYTIFISGFTSLVIFLPWYLSGDISSVSKIFGYSSKVSTYNANSCISFAQNVNGQHRFQGTFGGPITFSIFLVVFYIIYIGFILKKDIKNNYIKIAYIVIPSLFVLPSIFLSYSKTSILGLIFGASIFAYLSAKFIFKKSLKKGQMYYIYGFLLLLLIGLVIVKRDLFLHPDAILNRLENLIRSLEMLMYNPIGYGLGIAGPASQIGRSIESLGNWQILAQSTSAIAVFLPENWYVQILLEQGIIGFSIFISLFLILGFTLFKIVKNKKDYFSIGIFSSFVSICFMALFCHAFEDAGTVYPLFMIYGAYIVRNIKINN
ncbi:MAG: O-antigen ligase family protein [Candidatus Gracilibacteria bacterium]